LSLRLDLSALQKSLSAHVCDQSPSQVAFSIHILTIFPCHTLCLASSSSLFLPSRQKWLPGETDPTTTKAGADPRAEAEAVEADEEDSKVDEEDSKAGEERTQEDEELTQTDEEGTQADEEHTQVDEELMQPASKGIMEMFAQMRPLLTASLPGSFHHCPIHLSRTRLANRLCGQVLVP
jgi:hypothetical protein